MVWGASAWAGGSGWVEGKEFLKELRLSEGDGLVRAVGDEL